MKKTQIVIIHGGNSFRNYADYICFLKTTPLKKENLKSKKDWKDMLNAKLPKHYDVLSPRMPNKTNAKYEEWKIWFDRILKVLDKEFILIGHSLGGIFLAKYLAENNIKKKVVATILVAAPYDDSYAKDSLESVAEFSLPKSLENFRRQSQKIYLIYSRDDPIVHFSHLAKYRKKLPNAKVITFRNRGHFNQRSFPELINLINSF